MAKWKRVAWFYALTWLLLLVIPALHIATGSGPLDFDSAASRASAETGLPWTSNLWILIRLCLAEPMLWLLVLGAAIPSLAALLVCSSSRPSQLREWVSRFRPVGPDAPWRMVLLSYGSLVVLVTLGLLAVYALRSALPGPRYSHPSGLTGVNIVAALLMAAFLDQGGVLEELGWRGYALPELQAGLATPLGAAVLVGTGWALWHVPRDVVSGVVDRLGLLQYLLLYLPAFVANLVAVSVVAAYFVNRSGGSIIPAIMVHGLSNDAVGLSGVAAMGSVLSPYYQATRAVPFAVIATCLIAFGGRDLGLAKTRRPASGG